ncbi:cyclase family protein [Bradyrhizobium sp. BWA-3-5]|uniref:cyclase family protein n=1 Tax=Bradyrhizobium sp. BWA-3-5 TaxID=3080013 RepID=UPI00397D357B
MPKPQHGEHIGCRVDAPAHTIADQMDASSEKIAADRLVAEAVAYDRTDRDWKSGDMLACFDVKSMKCKHGISVGPDEIALVNFG